MRPSDHLRAAKERIERRGWRQGNMKPGNGPCCAHEAIACGAGMNRDNNLAANEALRIFVEANGLDRDRYNRASIVIVGWNDTRGRTLEEVNAAFDKAIAAAEEKERAHG